MKDLQSLIVKACPSFLVKSFLSLLLHIEPLLKKKTAGNAEYMSEVDQNPQAEFWVIEMYNAKIQMVVPMYVSE